MKKSMASNFYQILDFPVSDTKNGILCMFQGQNVQAKNNLPFEIKRVLVMKDMKPNDSRGGHTHHQTRQILFAVTGGCVVQMDNGKEKDSVKLNKLNQGILLEPYVWHVMKDFEPGTILLVLADTEYDETDYIRDYNEFLKFVK